MFPSLRQVPIHSWVDWAYARYPFTAGWTGGGGGRQGKKIGQYPSASGGARTHDPWIMSPMHKPLHHQAPHTYIHTYIHIRIHTYIHTHTYIPWWWAIFSLFAFSLSGDPSVLLSAKSTSSQSSVCWLSSREQKLLLV